MTVFSVIVLIVGFINMMISLWSFKSPTLLKMRVALILSILLAVAYVYLGGWVNTFTSIMWTLCIIAIIRNIKFYYGKIF